MAVPRTNAYIDIEAPGQIGYAAKRVATAAVTNLEANARLIAAAPNLLAALHEVCRVLKDSPAIIDTVWAGPGETLLDLCLSEIASATGNDN